MSSQPVADAVSNPFRILGLPNTAGEDEIRRRYLELIKQFPPDRDPERFRAIHAAYEEAKDPLVIARRLLQPPGDTPPAWSDVIEVQAANPPRLTVDLLLSLGNRDEARVRVDEEHTS